MDNPFHVRGSCRVLASKATAILYVIRDNAEEADGTKLQLAIDKTNACAPITLHALTYRLILIFRTLETIRADVVEWSTYSFWTSVSTLSRNTNFGI